MEIGGVDTLRKSRDSFLYTVSVISPSLDLDRIKKIKK